MINLYLNIGKKYFIIEICNNIKIVNMNVVKLLILIFKYKLCKWSI